MKHTIHVPGTRCTLTCNIENVSKIQTKLIKCTGKHRAIKIKTADRRVFPLYGTAMTTARYVKRYFELNNTLTHSSDYFEPLSTRPQEWPQEPLYEEIEEDQGDTMSYDFEASENLPVWLTASVPPEWIKD